MTTSPPVLLDTDTLSAILRRDPVMTARAQDYLRVHQRFGMISGKHWSAVITYRDDRVRLISVRRARVEEVAIYES